MNEVPKRVPCYAQAQGADNTIDYPDENTPCLICSGDVITKSGHTHVCPFTKYPLNSRFAVFREGVDLRYLTDAERVFEKEQREKIEFADHGFMSCEL